MDSGSDKGIFGAVRMGYVVVGSGKLDEWKRFATEAIGLHLAVDTPERLAFRMDAHARRLVVEDAPCEDVLATGWQLDSEHVLQQVLDRLAAKGVSAERVQGDEAAARGVEYLHRFTGPKGLLIELFIRPLLDEQPLAMRVSGFRLGDGGMGHISLMSREPRRCIAFWQDIFDARISDRIELAVGKRIMMDVTFLRVNERHHSVAVAATRGGSIDMFRTRIQHLNLEAATLDDLSEAYQRCQGLGYKLTRNIGQHPNDKELSFYVLTPSGFELEIGWDALAVDEDNWREGATYSVMSTWGHDVPGRFSSELSLGHVVQGIRSLARPEYYPW